MANQIEMFQHLVDNCEDPNMKWILQEQLDKETRRVRKAKMLRQLEREQALMTEEVETPILTDDQPKPRGRPKKKED